MNPVKSSYIVNSADCLAALRSSDSEAYFHVICRWQSLIRTLRGCWSFYIFIISDVSHIVWEMTAAADCSKSEWKEEASSKTATGNKSPVIRLYHIFTFSDLFFKEHFQNKLKTQLPSKSLLKTIPFALSGGCSCSLPQLQHPGHFLQLLPALP